MFAYVQRQALFKWTLLVGPSTGLIEMPISWSLDDYPAYEFGMPTGLQSYKAVLENWTADFDYMQSQTTYTDVGGILTFTFHPMVGAAHLVKLLSKISNALTWK